MKIVLNILVLVWLPLFGISQTIEKSSIDSGGASASAGGIEILYTIGEVAIAERSASGVSVSEGFINPEFRLQINTQVLLQGSILSPDTPGLMNDDLRTSGLIPTTSPFADGLTCNASIFNTTGNDAIVDWVWVSIRSNLDNQRQIQGRSALLQRDGDIVDIDGTSDVTLTIPQNTYFIAVQHRNHLGVMSAAPIQFDDTSAVVIDFKDVGLATFGSNAQVLLGSGDRALWAGDANGDKAIQFSGSTSDANAIKDYILADPSNFLNFITFSSTGYLPFDIDLNGLARFSGSDNDSNIIKDNVLAHPGNFLGLPTFTISTTVPEITN